MRKLIILFIFICNTSIAQVVNVEDLRVNSGDSLGWFGNAIGSLSILDNTTTQSTLETGITAEHIGKKAMFLFVNKIDLMETNGIKSDNVGMQHVRFNYKLTKIFIFEAFAQAQYNTIMGIKDRELLGAGLRLRIFKAKKFLLHVGLSPMLQYKEFTNSDGISREIKLNSYFSLKWEPNELISFSSTTYYQPNVSNFNDYGISTESSIEFKFSKRFSFGNSIDFSFDSEQPAGIPKSSSTFKSSITYKFR